MKSKKLIRYLALFSASALLASCGEKTTEKVARKLLDAPTNVVIHTGDDEWSSEDDYVTFDAVENASGYQVYVYKSGDTKAKVTSGEGTQIELPTPLDGGSYKVQVVAVGDGVSYNSSNGSDAIDYTVRSDDLTLATPKDISMDWDTLTISFKGDLHATNYNVFAYKSDKDGKFNEANLLTNFKVPSSGAEAVSYKLSDTVAAEFEPGYFLFTVQALGNDSHIKDGALATSALSMMKGVYATPEISAEVPENGGILVTLSNYAKFYNNTKLTINVYDSATSTTPITSKSLEYSQSTSMFGQTTINNTLGLEVKDSGDAGTLITGNTYYVEASITADGVIYANSVVSSKVEIKATKAGTGKKSQGGGGPGGGGGGGMSITVPSTFDIDTTAQTFTLKLGDAALLNYIGTKDATPRDGCTYSWTFASGDSGAPFTINSYLELKTDNTAHFFNGAAGPLSEVDKTGTWTLSGTTATVNF